MPKISRYKEAERVRARKVREQLDNEYQERCKEVLRFRQANDLPQYYIELYATIVWFCQEDYTAQDYIDFSPQSMLGAALAITEKLGVPLADAQLMIALFDPDDPPTCGELLKRTLLETTKTD
jgi:hypothetical protein